MKNPKQHNKVICSCNILELAVATTGFCGGDSGHGGQTFIAIEELAGGQVLFKTDKEGAKLNIELYGDSELETFIKGLSFVISTLKKEIKNKSACIDDPLGK